MSTSSSAVQVHVFKCLRLSQVCRFCWHRIRTDENGLCPACRRVSETCCFPGNTSCMDILYTVCCMEVPLRLDLYQSNVWSGERETSYDFLILFQYYCRLPNLDDQARKHSFSNVRQYMQYGVLVLHVIFVVCQMSAVARQIVRAIYWFQNIILSSEALVFCNSWSCSVFYCSSRHTLKTQQITHQYRKTSEL